MTVFTAAFIFFLAMINIKVIENKYLRQINFLGVEFLLIPKLSEFAIINVNKIFTFASTQVLSPNIESHNKSPKRIIINIT